MQITMATTLTSVTCHLFVENLNFHKLMQLQGAVFDFGNLLTIPSKFYRIVDTNLENIVLHS